MHMLTETEELLICMQCCESFSLMKGGLTVFPDRQSAGWESRRSGINQPCTRTRILVLLPPGSGIVVKLFKPFKLPFLSSTKFIKYSNSVTSSWVFMVSKHCPEAIVNTLDFTLSEEGAIEVVELRCDVVSVVC